jgi:hypothetical protein
MKYKRSLEAKHDIIYYLLQYIIILIILSPLGGLLGVEWMDRKRRYQY